MAPIVSVPALISDLLPVVSHHSLALAHVIFPLSSILRAIGIGHAPVAAPLTLMPITDVLRGVRP